MSPIRGAFGGWGLRGFLPIGAPLPLVVSGGTLTSDDTYYYRTFTNSSSTGDITDYLTIENASLTFDYALVAGGGGGYRTNVGQVVNGITILNAVTGGGGGVLTGSLTLNPSSYSIRVGAGGTNATANWNAVKGYDSKAFNDVLTAVGGGRVGDCSTTGTTGGSGGARFGSGCTPTNNGTSGQGNQGAQTVASPGVVYPSGGDCKYIILNFGSCDGFVYCNENNFAHGGSAGGASSAPTNKNGFGCSFGVANPVAGGGAVLGPALTTLGLTVGACGGNYSNSPNTGFGGGGDRGSTQPSEGVLRIRYLRTAVGG